MFPAKMHTWNCIGGKIMFCYIGEWALKVSQTGKVMLKHQVFVVRRTLDLDDEACLGQAL